MGPSELYLNAASVGGAAYVHMCLQHGRTETSSDAFAADDKKMAMISWDSRKWVADFEMMHLYSVRTPALPPTCAHRP